MPTYRTAIELRDLRIHARHGVHPPEFSTGHWFRIDLRVEPPAGMFGQEDLIGNTLDYEALHAICQRVMAQRANLLETLATAILNQIKEIWPDCGTLWVRIAKLHPPFGGYCGEVAIEMSSL